MKFFVALLFALVAAVQAEAEADPQFFAGHPLAAAPLAYNNPTTGFYYQVQTVDTSEPQAKSAPVAVAAPAAYNTLPHYYNYQHHPYFNGYHHGLAGNWAGYHPNVYNYPSAYNYPYGYHGNFGYGYPLSYRNYPGFTYVTAAEEKQE